MRQVAGTSQFRKLLFSVEYSDTHGPVWKISPWKGLFWLVLSLVLLVVAYSFLISSQASFLQSALFYAILIVILVIIVWVIGNFVWKGRGFFVGFILAWILILAFYLLLAGMFMWGLKWMTFEFGTSVWVAITSLAIVGAGLINGTLDRKDAMFGIFVFIVLMVGNAPIFANGGFFAELDKFIPMVIENLAKLIHP